MILRMILCMANENEYHHTSNDIRKKHKYAQECLHFEPYSCCRIEKRQGSFDWMFIYGLGLLTDSRR